MANIKGLNKKLDKIKREFSAHFSRGDYTRAIGQAKLAHAIVPKHPQPLADIAACYIYLKNWPEALRYAKKALAWAPDNLSALDAASHALGELGEFEQARPFGTRALALRDAAIQPLDSSAGRPPLLDPNPGGHKVIAFSLFGRDPKYCETAYLNVLAQPSVYPGWVCRFYVDDTVPESVKARLAAAGGQVFEVSGEAAQWFGTVWRFLALDDEKVERVIFRDADSLISQREADAVLQWEHEGQAFHLMRDGGSHTELILAGMWGCVRGALPSMRGLLSTYLTDYNRSTRFTDQYFLRENIWPYARGNCLQHDSVFDSPGSVPFPRPFEAGEWRVGGDVNCGFFESPVTEQGRSQQRWALLDEKGQVYCEYASPVHEGQIKVQLPRDLLLRMQAKELRFRALS